MAVHNAGVTGVDLRPVEATIGFLEEVQPAKMVFNHCTGSVVMSRMQERFGAAFVPGASGMVLEV